ARREPGRYADAASPLQGPAPKYQNTRSQAPCLAHAFVAMFVNRSEDVIARGDLTGMNPKAAFLDQGRPPASGLKHNTFRSLLDFEIASGMQTEPVSHRFRQNHTTGFVNLQPHTISTW